MFHHSSGKKCFSIESLVGKEASSRGPGSTGGAGSGEEPIRPTALRFSESLHPAASGVFGSCFQGSGGRTLYSTGPDVVLQEPGAHGHGGLPLHPLQLPPQGFFSPQHREALGFYPWVLRSRYLGHRFQGERGECVWGGGVRASRYSIYKRFFCWLLSIFQHLGYFSCYC